MSIKYCMSCGNGNSATEMSCGRCGLKPYIGIRFCRNCGRENVESFAKCSGCNSALIAKQNAGVFFLLSLFMLAPFHRFYAGNKKAGYMTLVIFFTGLLLVGVAPENIYCQFGLLISWGALFVWWLIDCLRIWLHFPNSYLNGDGLPIG